MYLAIQPVSHGISFFCKKIEKLSWQIELIINGSAANNKREIQRTYR